MDELAYQRYYAQERKAREIYDTLLEMYGKEQPWKRVYLLALRDGLLTDEDRHLLNKFFPR